MQEQEQSDSTAREARRLLEELRVERAQLGLERRLLESTLPEAVKTQLRERYRGRIFEMAELERELNAQRQMLADLAESGLIRGHGYEKPTFSTQITEAEKVQAAFDRLFDLEVDSRFGAIRGFSSIREAYARVTGDASVSGLSGQTQLGLIRVEEAAPLTRITEADTTTATFSYLLGTSMNKRLLKDYQAWPAEWQRFCTITPIRDFKQQTRVRLGAFGSLPLVAEDTPYTSVSLTDPAVVDTIEIGFVGGQVNPALFIQDLPNMGLPFSQDAVAFKIRHEYGAAVVDYRGFYRGI